MKRELLITLASVLVLSATAAGAQSAMSFAHSDSRSRGPVFTSQPAAGGFSVRCRDGDRRHGRHDGRRHHDGNRGCGFVVDGWAYADGEWALYNNRSWESDSYNDWWHDNPDRAFPRWVQQQRGGPCDPDRMWWSGTGWHC